MVVMGQSDLEMQQAQCGEGHGKPDYWDSVFHNLADADKKKDAARTAGVSVIHIRELKKYFKDSKSLQVGKNEKP